MTPNKQLLLNNISGTINTKLHMIPDRDYWVYSPPELDTNLLCVLNESSCLTGYNNIVPDTINIASLSEEGVLGHAVMAEGPDFRARAQRDPQLSTTKEKYPAPACDHQ